MAEYVTDVGFAPNIGMYFRLTCMYEYLLSIVMNISERGKFGKVVLIQLITQQENGSCRFKISFPHFFRYVKLISHT